MPGQSYLKNVLFWERTAIYAVFRIYIDFEIFYNVSFLMKNAYL